MIVLNNLSIGYTKPLIKPLNIKFEDGYIYGILGKSGCGKSTLLKTIAGLHKPLSGKVDRPKDTIYMMHQRYTNFEWLTCLDNILIAERHKKNRKNREQEAFEILSKVGLGNYADRFPTELSGGMQQRLSLARVLFAKPKYLLMDEPMSALDDTTRAEMQKLVVELHKKINNTIIMVTHSVDEAHKLCDNIITLS